MRTLLPRSNPPRWCHVETRRARGLVAAREQAEAAETRRAVQVLHGLRRRQRVPPRPLRGLPRLEEEDGVHARELAGQRNAARRFLEGKKNSGTVAEIEQYQWYQDLVALASVATSNRGLGPACKLCKRKTTLKVTNNRGPHFGRKYYKCLPCAKWNSWAEPEPTLEDSAWEREDEAALAEAEAAALEALDAARDDATVDLTDEPADAST